MDAAQALADLTEISSQIESAVIATEEGALVASTLADPARGERLARGAVELLRAADALRSELGRERLLQLEAALPDGSVFVVREAGHVVAAVTGPEPTVGLVFYDLKTCLRLLGQEEAERATEGKAERGPRRKEEAAAPQAESAGASGGGEEGGAP